MRETGMKETYNILITVRKHRTTYSDLIWPDATQGVHHKKKLLLLCHLLFLDLGVAI